MVDRLSGRDYDEIRSVSIEKNILKHAYTSCLIKMGHTHVLCSATVEDKVPFWMRQEGQGWITAEYGMLPCSTHQRMSRESVKGKQSGRTHEIQRLIGRSLRSGCDLTLLGEHQVRIDCDVIQADGGTRMASITGSWVALHLAMEKLVEQERIEHFPLSGFMAGISCGLSPQGPILDLDYEEDSQAWADSNFVFHDQKGIVEIQVTAEHEPFSQEIFTQMLSLAQKGCAHLYDVQKKALGIEN